MQPFSKLREVIMWLVSPYLIIWYILEKRSMLQSVVVLVHFQLIR